MRTCTITATESMLYEIGIEEEITGETFEVKKLTDNVIYIETEISGDNGYSLPIYYVKINN